MERNHLFLRIVLIWVCVGHVATGLAALISGPEGVRLGSMLYGAAFEPTGQFLYIIRPIGAYMLAMAWVQFMAIRHPWRYRAVIDATLVVLALCLFQRVAYAQDIFAAFGIPPGRHWTNTVIFLVTAVLLLAVRLGMKETTGEKEALVSPRERSG